MSLKQGKFELAAEDASKAMVLMMMEARILERRVEAR